MSVRALMLPAVDVPPTAAFTRYLADGASLYVAEVFNRGQWRSLYVESTSAAIEPPGPTCEEIGNAVWSYAERTLTG